MYHTLNQVRFPEPRGIKINMMPFIMGDPSTLPLELHGYLPLITHCDSITPGRVAYLTVTEDRVQGGETQRRGGIHTEGGIHLFGGGWGGGRFGGGTDNSDILGELKELRRVSRDSLTYEQGQRLEYLESLIRDGSPSRADGVYMASTDGACRVWDSTTYDVDAFGALKGRPSGNVAKMDANRMYWMTDRTPHEALPSRFSGTRQFFRIVSNDVDGWWKNHSTSNPLGILPDCKILEGSKFNS